jgi:hypothetical protein
LLNKIIFYFAIFQIALKEAKKSEQLEIHRQKLKVMQEINATTKKSIELKSKENLNLMKALQVISKTENPK